MKTWLASIALGSAIISTQALAQDNHERRGGWSERDMTRDEAKAMADAMFQRFDSNHDGLLTREEAEEAAAGFGASGRAQHMIERMFGDAKSLTLQQAEAEALSRFERDDLNHDGIVTADERRQARAAKAGRASAPAAPQPAPTGGGGQ